MATGCSLNVAMNSRAVCSVCLEPYSGRQPKLLPCFHTFCLSCLTALQQKVQHHDTQSPGNIICPTCRKTTPVPTGGVAQFQSNFYIEDDKEPESVQPLLCDVCDDQTPSQFCTKCASKFCRNCQKHHDKSCASRGSTGKQITTDDGDDKAAQGSDLLNPLVYSATGTVNSTGLSMCMGVKTQPVEVNDEILKAKTLDASHVIFRAKADINSDDISQMTSPGGADGVSEPKNVVESEFVSEPKSQMHVLKQLLAHMTDHETQSTVSSGIPSEWQLKLENLAGKVGMLQTTYTLLCQNVTVVNEKNAKLATDGTALQTDLLVLQKDHAALQKDHTALQKDYVSLQREMSSAHDKSTILCQEVAEIQADNIKLHHELKDVQTHNTKLHQELQDLQADNTKQHQELQNLQTDNTKLHQELQDLQADNTKLYQELQDLQTNNSKLHQKLQDLQTDNAKLHQEFQDLQADNTKLHHELNDLPTDNTKLHQKLQDLQTDNTKLHQELQDLQTDNTKLHQELNDLPTDKTKLHKELLDLQTDNTKLHQKLNDLQTDNTKLRQELNDLQTDNTKLCQELNDLQTHNTKLRQELNDLQTENTILLWRVFWIEKVSDTVASNVQANTQRYKNLQRELEERMTRLYSLEAKIYILGSKVAFQVILNKELTVDKKEQVLVLDGIISNTGGGYSAATGIFTAPVPGRYVFMATSGPHIIGGKCSLGIYTRDCLTAFLFACDNRMSTAHAAVDLQRGDKVCLKSLDSDVYIFSDGWWTTFTGALVQPQL